MWPGIEPRSPRPLANTQTIMPMSSVYIYICKVIIINKYILVFIYTYLIPCIFICDPEFHVALLQQSSGWEERYLKNWKNQKYSQAKRDNGLIIIRNPNGPKLDSYRKRISNALKLLGFKITINTNLKIVNFLDLTLNLKKDTFEPQKIERYTYLHTHFFKPPTLNYQTIKFATDYPIILLTLAFSTKMNTYMTTR